MTITPHPDAAARFAVDVVLPCLNEAAALPAVLASLPPGFRAVVVDNGSDDDSAAVAAASGAFVVTEPRRGFGSACAAGVAASTAPIVAFCDADGSLDLRHLPALVAPVAAGEADLVLGRRRPTSAGAWPGHARAANVALAAIMRRRTGYPLRDLGPMRVMRRDALLELDLRDRGCGYPLELVLRASLAGWRVLERDVPYAPRTGRSKVTGTVGGTIRAVRDMRRVLAEVSA